MCRDYSITPPTFRALPRQDQIDMIADSNMRARAMKKAQSASKPKPRYNATDKGSKFWTGG